MKPSTIVVGAGLSGLTCARKLVAAGHSVKLIDGSSSVGGRVRTELFEGFRLDAGFQVYFTAYEHAAQELDYGKLNFKKYSPGAMVWDGDKLHSVSRNKPLATALSGFYSIADKLHLLSWSREATSYDVTQADTTAETFLFQYGFSQHLIDTMMRPFLGGIFLDRSLGFSARQLNFVWAKLAAGNTVTPALGMGEISRQLAADIPSDSWLLRTPVAAVNASDITLNDGRRLEADHVVLAVDAPAAAKLLNQKIEAAENPKSSNVLYFVADKAPLDDPIIAINGSPFGVVNEVAPLSVVSKDLAPAGKHLISVTVLGHGDKPIDDLADTAKIELREWFPKANVKNWSFLQGYSIPFAQMQQPPGFLEHKKHLATKGIYLAGEYLSNGSIDGAIESGQLAARAILK